MQVFISWSGSTSRELALALRSWIKVVVQSLDPWMSEVDLDIGKRWTAELATRLEQSGLGIVCVTPENISSPWLMFESGALAKSMQEGRLIPLLWGLNRGQLPLPLSQFQALEVNKTDLLRLVMLLQEIQPTNNVPAEITRMAFDATWPSLEIRLQQLRIDPPPPPPPVADALQEILTVVRGLSNASDIAGTSVDGSKETAMLAWLIKETADAESGLVQYDAMIKFYNERSGLIPELVDEQHRALRYRLGFLVQARNALAALRDMPS